MDEITNKSLVEPKTEEISTEALDSEITDISTIEDEILADELCKKFNAKRTSLIIHGFALAHGTTTLVLGSGVDTPFLTAETVGMLYTILKTNNYTTSLPLTLIASTLGSVIAGKGVSVAIGAAARVIFPGGGEALDRIINVPSTMITTEILGWGTFKLLSLLDDNQISESVVKKKKLSKEERKLIIEAAKDYREKYGTEGKKLYKKMSKTDKKMFNELIKRIGDKDTDDDMRMQLSNEILDLISKYSN